LHHGHIRFIGILAVLAAVFLGARWQLAPRALKPDTRLPTFHQVDVQDPRFKLETTSFASDNDAVRDALRQAVLDAAVALKDAPCDQAVKARYIAAATKYARAWISIVPCIGTRICRQSDNARIELAQKAFGSPFDRRVREAMQRAHATGAIVKGDFPDDAARLVATLAGDGMINPDVPPKFKEVAEALGNGPLVCRPASAG
jgi:multidrug efflux pump subunit AcrA (membrane-fusion protein)